MEPVPAVLHRIAEQVGEGNASHEAICKSDKVRAVVRAEMQAAGKLNGLQGIELIQDVVLTEEEWTPQNGLVTNSQKLNRRVVVERFMGEVESVYAAGGS